MRVLLDAHVSPARIGRRLSRKGHDVLALANDRALSTLADEEVLALAAEQRRVTVTHNIRHFAPILRTWAEGARSHAGCVLVTLPHTAYGALLGGLETLFDEHPRQGDWTDRAVFLAAAAPDQ